MTALPASVSCTSVLRADDARLPAGAHHPDDGIARPGSSGARATRGFTVIELMIALAVVAILASVALPAYNYAHVRANRAAAQSYLLDLANRQELYLLDARTYTTAVDSLLPPPSFVAPHYTVAIAVPSGSTIANSYRITATPVTTSMQSSDGDLTIDQDGRKSGTW